MDYEICGVFFLVKKAKSKNRSYFLFLVFSFKGSLKARTLFLLKIGI